MVEFNRRSFACSDKLWSEMREHCNDCISVSSLIRKAVVAYLENYGAEWNDKSGKEQPKKISI